MTYDQFWNEDAELVKFYREAHRLKQKAREQDFWIQGAYFYEALVDVSPIMVAFPKEGAKPSPYRESPFGFFDSKEERKAKREAEILENNKKIEKIMDAWMRSSNKRLKKGGGDDDS